MEKKYTVQIIANGGLEYQAELTSAEIDKLVSLAGTVAPNLA